ncbi:uncharacterized protein [Nicotiana sylvestris]|uniref:uncharacterized protein n=1 Tax=Nicotiana sylvestris TaxID=4096 RepID=UPI00388C91D7
MVEEAQLQTEEISEDGSAKVPESTEVEDVSRRDEQLGGVPEGSDSEALRKGENAPSPSLKAIDIAFYKSRAELNRSEDGLKRITEERDALKLFSGQKEEIKDLQAELAKAQKEQTDLIEQVEHKAEKIEQLHEEAKMKEAETLGWKQNMDRLASEKDTARAQLSLSERQLQSMKEKSLARAKKIEELGTRLAVELAKPTFEAGRIKAESEAMVAVYRADAEVAQV